MAYLKWKAIVFCNHFRSLIPYFPIFLPNSYAWIFQRKFQPFLDTKRRNENLKIKIDERIKPDGKK